MPGLRPVVASGAALAVVIAGLVATLVVLAHRPPVGGAAPTVPVAAPSAVPEAAGIPSSDPSSGSAPVPTPSPAWVTTVAARTAIPARALQAYAQAQLDVAREDPSCRIGWNTLAGIGAVESAHGTHGGSAIGADGIDRPTVLGPPLDGTDGNLAIPDTDGGRLDGDPVWDRAVGPMQFVPSTWAQWGRRASGVGTPDPSDIDDAALTAATYLCTVGGDLGTPAGWRAAIAAYNAPVEYAVLVADTANEYAARSRT